MHKKFTLLVCRYISRFINVYKKMAISIILDSFKWQKKHANSILYTVNGKVEYYY